MNLGFSPSPFRMEQMNDDKEHDQQQQAFNFGLNHRIVSSSSSSSASCHIFFNSTQDHAAFYHPQLYQPHHHRKEDYYSYHGGLGSSYEVENGLWKKEDEVSMVVKDGDRVKWMKKADGAVVAPTASIGAANIDEVKKIKVKVKVKPSSSLETDLSSNTSSFNCNTPIRVCSDCHTTKTPLWRSGPKGPKSLCNACGIRQRKARRAMAAGGNGGGMVSDPPRAMKVKEKIGKSGHSSELKKRCKLAAAGSGGGSSSSSGKKIGFEEFLINLSNKLAFHRVFPQDEKEAAILLMALSSGLVHG